jgi:hypothetical protein
MRRTTSLVLVLTVGFFLGPLSGILRAQCQPELGMNCNWQSTENPPQQGRGHLRGNTVDAAKQPSGNLTVKLKEVSTGKEVAVTQSAANGQFGFPNVNPTQYIIEITDATGKVLGTATATVTAGATATVTITSAVLTAAGAAALGTGGALAGLLTGTSAIVIAGVSVGAAILGIAALNDEDPSATE